MKKYKETAEKICPVEQDLATGFDNLGEKIKDPLKNINPLLLDASVRLVDAPFVQECLHIGVFFLCRNISWLFLCIFQYE